VAGAKCSKAKRAPESDKSTGAPAPPTANTLPPELADHPDYQVMHELGRGGMGVIYLAHNRLTGRDEVLKVVSAQLVERPGVRHRFLREIQSAAKLNHKNIVTAYSAMRFGKSIVLTMEYSQSPLAGKHVGILSGQVVAVADDLDELIERLRQLEAEPRQSLCLEFGLDYAQVQEIWGLS
jgi:hypothetical protein